MNKPIIKIILIALSFIVLIFLFVLYRNQPKLELEIKKHAVEKRGEEQLSLKLYELETKIDFSVSFMAEDGSNEIGFLKSKLVQVPWFPFIWYDNNFEINFEPGKRIDDETFVIYEITGSLTNFTTDTGRVIIIDSFENLIDEKYFEYEKKVVGNDVDVDAEVE